MRQSLQQLSLTRRACQLRLEALVGGSARYRISAGGSIGLPDRISFGRAVASVSPIGCW